MEQFGKNGFFSSMEDEKKVEMAIQKKTKLW